MTRKPLAELKLAAQPEMIATAKRTAAALGSTLGFSLEDLDELNIAVAQACDSAIEAGREAWGDEATLKLTFYANERGLEVEVQAQQLRSSHPAPSPPVARQRVIRDEVLDRLAQDMIRCFVDDFYPSVSSRRVRFRLVKYLVG
jgi:anti-sigma regulatory factor (Ser/Thr protein kinase)